MQDSLFTKIIKGEIPSHKVYEDNYTFAFMDIYPVQPGMVVIASKVQVGSIYDLDDENYQGLWEAAKVVANKLKIVFPDKKKIAVQVEGLDVEHAHVKLFPIDSGEEFRASQDTESPVDHPALAALAEQIANA